MTVVLATAAAVAAVLLIRRELRLAALNRNSSRLLNEAQKKARATVDAGCEYGGTRLP